MNVIPVEDEMQDEFLVPETPAELQKKKLKRKKYARREVHQEMIGD